MLKNLLKFSYSIKTSRNADTIYALATGVNTAVSVQNVIFR